MNNIFSNTYIEPVVCWMISNPGMSRDFDLLDGRYVWIVVTWRSWFSLSKSSGIGINSPWREESRILLDRAGVD